MRDIPLRELAHVIRSKNAGPFEVTFDVIFDANRPMRKSRQAAR